MQPFEIILKMKENTQHFQYTTLYYKKGKNATEIPKKKKKWFVQCMEKVL